ncbi:hypothetical protein VTG60DRAFT_768 [Thermothelomyces hinnuleus]
MAGESSVIKVLGLHGMGTSGRIFQSQTAAFRSKLPDTFVFEFLDAPHRTNPAPATDIFFKSDHLGWWQTPTVDNIRNALEVLDEHLKKHGPYDILMGFSQGCSLIASYILFHTRKTPNAPLPFKSAVFICGGIPLSVLEYLGIEVSEEAKEINQKTGDLLRNRTQALARMAERHDDIKPGHATTWDNLTGLVHNPANAEMPKESNVFGLDLSNLPEDLLIRMPTVHIWGAKDPRFPAACQLAGFCSNRREYDHGGGHEIPRSTVVSQTIANLIIELVKQIH